MHTGPLPLVLEDRTGHLQSSDFDEIYDRLFLRVAPAPQRPTTLLIYNMGLRSSRRRAAQPPQRAPVAALDFSPDGSLGTVAFASGPISMSRFLRKTSLFGGSLQRKFLASDSREYRWGFRGVPGQEWSCTSAEGYLVAHYDLKPPDARAYGVSGHSLTIYEPFAHLAVELLASLTIMRHIALHGL